MWFIKRRLQLKQLVYTNAIGVSYNFQNDFRIFIPCCKRIVVSRGKISGLVYLLRLRDDLQLFTGVCLCVLHTRIKVD